MESKKRIGMVGIILIIIVIAIIAVSAVFIYSKTNDNKTELESQQMSDGNTIAQVNNIINEQDIDIAEENIADNETNNKEIEVKIEMHKGEKIEDSEDLYKLKYDVQVNGKKVAEIEDSSGGDIESENYKIEKIKDVANNKEYIVLKIYRYYVAGGPGTDLYVIDENANVLGKLKNSGLTSYMLGVVRNEQGEMVDYEESSGIDIMVYDDYIIDYKDVISGVEKHKYTVNNGIFTDSIEKTYDNSEVERAGK